MFVSWHGSDRQNKYRICFILFLGMFIEIEFNYYIQSIPIMIQFNLYDFFDLMI